MAQGFVLRIQSRTGRYVLKSLSQNSTLYELQKAIAENINIETSYQKILFGYPPRQLKSSDSLCSLHSLGITSGETLRVERLSSSQRETDVPQSTVANSVPHSEDMKQDSGTQVRAENPQMSKSNEEQSKKELELQRLKRSILLCNGKDTPRELRELAAGIILSNPHKFTSAVLGKTSKNYVEWLLRDESWGGAIELSVYSEHFRVELDVVDIQTQRIDRFGEGSGHVYRALLIYDGIHYDPLVLEEANIVVQSLFSTSNQDVLISAVQLAKEAYEARQYTDISKFSLRCLVCGAALGGQVDAHAHATATGHINFHEVQ